MASSDENPQHSKKNATKSKSPPFGLGEIDLEFGSTVLQMIYEMRTNYIHFVQF
jgi:hypothetical protein